MDAARRDPHTDSTRLPVTTTTTTTTHPPAEATTVWSNPAGGATSAATIEHGDFDGPEPTIVAERLMPAAPFRDASEVAPDTGAVARITGNTVVGPAPQWSDLRTQIGRRSPRFSPIGFVRPSTPTQRVPAESVSASAVPPSQVSFPAPSAAASSSTASTSLVANLRPVGVQQSLVGHDHPGALASVDPGAARGGSAADVSGWEMQQGRDAAVLSPAAARAVLPPPMDDGSVGPTELQLGPELETNTIPQPTCSLHVLGSYLGAPSQGRSFDVPLGESFEIGKKPGSAFANDRYVDRYHAALTPDATGVVLEDFGTTNGVYVRVDAPQHLGDGDHIRVGRQLLQLRLLDVPPQTGARTIGCPDPGYWGRLDMLLRPGLVGASFPIDDYEAVIGDVSGDLQFPDDEFIATEHCRIETSAEGIVIEDLGSAHGTFVRLQCGDHVATGSVLLIGQTLLEVGATNHS